MNVNFETPNTEKNPRELLSPEVLEIISRFVQEKRGKYVEFDKDNPEAHYYDCTVYSRELKGRLEKVFPDLVYMNICEEGVLITHFGTLPFPGMSLHCALYLRSLNIVIEPQTGVITFYSKGSEYSAVRYYSKELQVDEDKLVFMSNPDFVDKKL